MKQTKEAAPEQEPAQDGHDDAAQDKELILSMLKKHGVVSDEEAYAEALKMAGEMHQAYQEMGYKEDEAAFHAAHSMKLAKHMAAKQAGKPGEEQQPEQKPEDKAPAAEEAKPPVMEGKEDECKQSEGEEKKEAKEDEAKEDESKKESYKEIIALKAQVAKLMEDKRIVECEKHLETVCKNSGLPMSATKLFRESIGAPKSVEQIDRDFKIFVSAYKEKSAGEGVIFFQPEKVRESSGKALNLSECLR